MLKYCCSVRDSLVITYLADYLTKHCVSHCHTLKGFDSAEFDDFVMVTAAAILHRIFLYSAEMLFATSAFLLTLKK